LEVVAMVFEDKFGKILRDDEVDELSYWEIEERGIHVADEEEGW
jgi:hypothetical protein